MVEPQEVLERFKALGVKFNASKPKEAIALMPATLWDLKLMSIV